MSRTNQSQQQEKPVWEKKRPDDLPKKSKKLTDAQKSKAEKRAAAAGRPYPNLVDNMAVAKAKKGGSIRKTTTGKDRNYRSTEEGAGMTEKGVKAYRKANPGSKLKTAVTGKVKKGSKDAKRRKSFCARMSGVKGPTSKNGKLTRKGAALKRWKCN